MQLVNERILVSVDMAQKSTMKIGDVLLKTATEFDKNYRERSPVIAKVEEGNRWLKSGDIILCHHNHFYPPSPYYLYDNLYSIPFNKTIFAILDMEGNLTPVCDNILGQKVDVETLLPIPVEERKQHKNRIIVTHPGWTKYKVGQLLFTRPSAPYDIVYNIDGIVKRVTKISEDMVVGYVKTTKN